jgi:hypothetical protein
MNTEVEMAMNSVERVLQYIRIDHEAPAIVPDNRPPPGWPSQGVVEFRNLSACPPPPRACALWLTMRRCQRSSTGPTCHPC